VAELHKTSTVGFTTASFIVRLAERDDPIRAEQILRAAVLQIDDRVTDLYAGAQAPENVSQLEKDNYRG
jgi:hypothetical protein